MDRAIQYQDQLDNFVKVLNTTNQKGANEVFEVLKGRKFDRILLVHTNGQKTARYFVCKNSWKIFGCKSFAQVNERRVFGTLDSIQDYDWVGYVGTPKSGTVAEKEHLAREASIAKQYKKRGRPLKATKP